jgi:hypothetical protein
MGALARLPQSVADVEPGGSVSLELTVRNTGTVVDQFNFELLGGAAAWTTFDPPTVSLFPQAEETVQAVFAPPRASDTASGPVPFGIRVESREDPQGSVVEEGTVNVAEFSDGTAELTPRATRVALRGRLQVAVDNRSNIPYQAELVGTDGESAYDYVFRPPLVDVPAGSVAFAKATIRPKAPYWRGPSTTQPFQVLLRQQHMDGAGPELGPAGTHPPELLADGAVVRDALLPGWLGKVVAGLLALCAVLALLWFTLVKPQITAAAQNQVKKDIIPVAMQVSKLNHAVGAIAARQALPPAPHPSGPPAPKPATNPHNHPASGTTGSKRVIVSTPVNASLTATGNDTTTAYPVPAGKTLEITDILLENSAGASGSVFLKDNNTVLMSWALADFRDLDYHWITPVFFPAKSRLQLTVSNCTGVCTPSLYFAGSMKS